MASIDAGRTWRVALALAAGMALAGLAAAGKPDDKGGGHGRPAWVQPGEDARHDAAKPGRDERLAPPAAGVALGAYFGEREREAVRLVFGAQVQAGRCPPGLAKKANGCRPPGLTKPWKLGQPLPAGVTIHALPPELKRRLGEPPPGYRFVRIGADILLIAIGTAIVVDAIEDLAGLL
ncbi:Nickel/cobalt transporter regulator [Tepidimonas sediminis]|uniref:Nickel/cobalt transporter regulator n=1 Tax=Tepidimonas sediminis TaxID=2588941 RepID=A0A554WIM6_9BURK|nr:RcnB family protein [Tepidimonas sediminis]TSE23431.1 Nickel/cobalt transporter regulator [Tepidimonas sediminis]